MSYDNDIPAAPAEYETCHFCLSDIDPGEAVMYNDYPYCHGCTPSERLHETLGTVAFVLGLLLLCLVPGGGQ